MISLEDGLVKAQGLDKPLLKRGFAATQSKADFRVRNTDSQLAGHLLSGDQNIQQEETDVS